jgi:predicted dehydrogenase
VLPVLDLLPQYEITAIYSQRVEVAEAAAAKYKIKHIAATLDELVAHPEVDLVLVLTTGPQHELALRSAIAAGKDVYCAQRRFSPTFRYAKDLIAKGYVGRVRSVRLEASVKTFGKTRAAAIRWSAFPENFMGVTSIFGAHMLPAAA